MMLYQLVAYITISSLMRNKLSNYEVQNSDPKYMSTCVIVIGKHKVISIFESIMLVLITKTRKTMFEFELIFLRSNYLHVLN